MYLSPATITKASSDVGQIFTVYSFQFSAILDKRDVYFYRLWGPWKTDTQSIVTYLYWCSSL